MSLEQTHPGTRTMERLDLEELPRGRISRVLVELVHGSAGRPVHVPVLVARGERPGPVFGLSAALHGNELNGIPVIHRLFDELDPRRLRGTVVAVVVVNVPGFHRHSRHFVDGKDLNSLFPGRPDGNASQVYVSRLLDRIVHRFDYLIDLHTASFGRINCLYVRADMTHPVCTRMADLQRPQIILHNPPSDHTLRGAAMEMGIPAITVEIGNPQVFQPRHIKPTLAGIRSMLGEVKMLPRRKVVPSKTPVLCERSYWIYTDHGGLLEVFPKVTDRVDEGAEIARQLNIFGDVVRVYRAPESGIVIGRSSNPVGQTGARIIHLGVVAAEDDRRFRPEPGIG